MNPSNDSPDNGRLLPEKSGRARAALALLAVFALAVAGVVSVDDVPPPKANPAALPSASIAAARPARVHRSRRLKPPATRDTNRRDEQLRDAVGDFRVLRPGDEKLPNTTIIASTEAETAPAPGGRPRWSGPYLGLNAGAAVGNSSLHTSVQPPGDYFLPPDVAQLNGIGPVNATPFGFVGGAQGGWNCQHGSVVYGLEADIDALALDDTQRVTGAYNSSPSKSFTLSQSISADWLVTVRPRLGYVLGDALLYGTGGLAIARIRYAEQFNDTFSPAFASESISSTRLGWTIGAGAEYALQEHWSLKGEYLYADFGQVNGSSPLVNPPGKQDRFDHSATFHAHLVRFGLNYRF